jgi:hypothetical protein
MASEVDIANRALTKLGDQRILTLTDNTKPARELNSMFTLVRDQEMRRHRWKFAIKRDQLTADAVAPAWGFQYAYELPSDYLGLVQVAEFYVRPYVKHQGRWMIEGHKLLSDDPPQLKFRYLARITNPGLFDPLFVEVFACKLAYEACETLTQSSTKKEGLAADYKFALAEAVRCDALEIPPDELPWGSWLESREGPGGTLGIQDTISFASGFSVA